MRLPKDIPKEKLIICPQGCPPGKGKYAQNFKCISCREIDNNQRALPYSEKLNEKITKLVLAGKL